MFEIIILSLIQGVTEFLPISSSSHLILLSNLLDLKNQSLNLDVSLHIGSFLAIITYFFKDLINFIKNRDLFIKIIISSIPVMVVGHLLVKYDLIYSLRNLKIIGWTTIIFGALLYVSDKFKINKKLDSNFNLKSAIFVGFLGVYIVLNPDLDNFDYMKLAPVACAFCYAISMTITKITSEKDNVYTQMIHLYFGALIISILFFIFTGNGQANNFSDPTFQFIFREWFTNPSYAWPFIIAMGFIGAFAFFFVFSAYSIASPSVVSLYEYSLIIWSILTGYILFNNIPTFRTFVGVSIIIGAGIYIYFREKAKDQLIVTDTPTR